MQTTFSIYDETSAEQQSYQMYDFNPDPFQTPDYYIETPQASTPILKQSRKKSQNPTEAKNIPKNLGGLLKNYYTNFYPELAKDNKAIKLFIITGQKKKNFTRQDLKRLFEDIEARNIAAEYFSSFQVIQDIIQSEKIPNTEIHLKYIKKLYIAAHNPEALATLKLPEQL